MAITPASTVGVRGTTACAILAAAGAISCTTTYLGPAGAVSPPLGAARPVDAADVVVARGYRIEAVATRLDRPTDVIFDAHGNAHVLEGGRPQLARGDVSRSEAFGHEGRLLVAACEPTVTGGLPSVRVAPEDDDGVTLALARNRDGGAVASAAGHGGLEQPVAARFDPTGRVLWVVDHGRLDGSGAGAAHGGCATTPHAAPRTGVLWKIERIAGSRTSPR